MLTIKNTWQLIITSVNHHFIVMSTLNLIHFTGKEIIWLTVFLSR